MSCQDVCIDMDGDGSSEFTREATPRARKMYKCAECSAVIAVGERHEYLTGKYDGYFWDARTCLACAEIRKVFCCGSWLVGELWSAMDEQVFHRWNELVAIDCLAKLTTAAAVAKMRAKYVESQQAHDYDVPAWALASDATEAQRAADHE
jgi:hypothetical protein